MGDLNYRIDLSDEEFRNTEGIPNLNVFLSHDQLSRQIEAKEAFSDYKERFISFSS